VISEPSRRIFPSVANVLPQIVWSKVDLPDPLGPISPTISF